MELGIFIGWRIVGEQIHVNVFPRESTLRFKVAKLQSSRSLIVPNSWEQGKTSLDQVALVLRKVKAFP